MVPVAGGFLPACRRQRLYWQLLAERRHLATSMASTFKSTGYRFGAFLRAIRVADIRRAYQSIHTHESVHTYKLPRIDITNTARRYGQATMNSGAMGRALDVAACDEQPHHNPLIAISNWFRKICSGGVEIRVECDILNTSTVSDLLK